MAPPSTTTPAAMEETNLVLAGLKPSAQSPLPTTASSPPGVTTPGGISQQSLSPTDANASAQLQPSALVAATAAAADPLIGPNPEATASPGNGDTELRNKIGAAGVIGLFENEVDPDTEAQVLDLTRDAEPNTPASTQAIGEDTTPVLSTPGTERDASHLSQPMGDSPKHDAAMRSPYSRSQRRVQSTLEVESRPRGRRYASMDMDAEGRNIEGE